jgi:DNA/RNA endonuclease G (NUC1)
MEMRAILIIALIFFCSCKRDRSKYENATTEECTSVNYHSNEITIIGSPDTSVLISTPPISPQQLQSKIVSLPASIPSIILRRKAYTTSYNSETHNPNWVAWHLTAEHVDGEIPRLRYFIEDEQVPTPRATNEDYKGSGWSRGHMCPAGDNKWDEVAMRESNLLTNICPQHSSLNSGLWNVIERDCRKWAKKYGEVYWMQYVNYQTGDTGYLYSSAPDSCIRYSFEVIGHDLPYSEDMNREIEFNFYRQDIDAMKEHNRFALFRITAETKSSRLRLANLIDQGLKMAPRGSLKLSNKDYLDLKKYIEKNF